VFDRLARLRALDASLIAYHLARRYIGGFAAIKSRQALLDYDDLIADRGALLRKKRRQRVGPLQAGPGHRSHSCGRGAGHRAPAMERHREIVGRILRRRRSAAGSSAPCLPLVTRNSRSTRSRAPGQSALPRSGEARRPAEPACVSLRTGAAAGFVPLLLRSA
jgi:hypothetical protein